MKTLKQQFNQPGNPATRQQSSLANLTLQENRYPQFSLRLILMLLLSMALVCLALSANAGKPSKPSFTRVSGLTPYTPPSTSETDPAIVTACMGPEVADGAVGINYRNSEAEPQIAVNPLDHDNMIAVWIQDRWSTGGAGAGLGAAYTKNGGATWNFVNVPFSRCAGGNPDNNGDFERATDPWVAFGIDGRAYFVALPYNTAQDGELAITVAISDDGGASWGDPIVVQGDPTLGTINFFDKQAIFTDPHDANLVYVVQTNFEARGGANLPDREKRHRLLFYRSENRGEDWELASVITAESRANFAACAQVVVLPDGDLVAAYFLENQAWGLYPTVSHEGIQIIVNRSSDKGDTWSAQVVVDTVEFPASPHISAAPLVTGFIWGAHDVELDIPYRSQRQCLDVAVNPISGQLYIVWEDARFNTLGNQGSVITTSTDGGESWSSPIAVNPDTLDSQAFNPSVAVAADGTVGVMFYDLRNDVFEDDPLSTDMFIGLFDKDLDNHMEKRITDISFDSRQALMTSGFFLGYFLGDYFGLEAHEDGFAALYVITNDVGVDAAAEFPVDTSVLTIDSRNRQDVVFSKISLDTKKK